MNDINEIENIEESSVSSVEKPIESKKPKRERTQAQIDAFERCRKSRQESIKRKEEDKIVKAVEIKEKRKKEIQVKDEERVVSEGGQAPLTPQIHQTKSGGEGGSIPPKKPKTKKKVIVYEPSDDDSESSYEIEIIPKPKLVKKTKPQRQEEQPQRQEETMVKLSDIVNWI